jgi:tryptophan halogenase
MNAIQKILIVGGGTAGWLTAAFLAKTLGSAAGGPQITLVESSEIGIIGVGEGSFPSIRGTLAAIGLDEARFIRECDATFKQGVHFVHWAHAPGSEGGAPDHYFHPFNSPSQRPGAPELLPYWLLGDAAGPDGRPRAFAEAATMQKRVADASRAPKRATDADWSGPMNYAYHFDAGKFAALLATHAKSLGVAHVVATVDRVDVGDDGRIAAVSTRDHGTLQADLYIDCSGFRAALIGAALGSPVKRLDDVLFVDRALAMQVPYPAADTPIASYTISTAHEAGWTWDIGLQQRRGIGYVYSSRHTSDERAEQVLRAYIGPAAQGLTPRALKLDVGYRERQWIGNCVAIGLSAGFLEPLESSGIGLIETAAYLVGYLLPTLDDLNATAARFNALMRPRFDRIVDFLKLHYAVTRRTDSAFWRDNADPASWPQSLRDMLSMWRSRPPHRLDFVADLEMYPTSSWQYVLYGMGYRTELAHGRAAWPRAAEAQREFATIPLVAQRALEDLPDHRRLVEAMVARAAGATAPARAPARPADVAVPARAR